LTKDLHGRNYFQAFIVGELYRSSQEVSRIARWVTDEARLNVIADGR